MWVTARIRRMFDLDANPTDIAATLSHSTLLKPLVEACPGVRSPTHWSPFESCMRAIVGQQVSVAAARKVSERLAQACAEHAGQTMEYSGGTLLSELSFPHAEQLLALPDDALPMPKARKRTLRAACDYFIKSQDPASIDPRQALLQLPGIGPWTIALLGMRGLGDPDVFPAGDLGLIRAAERLGCDDKNDLLQQMQHCKPWRSYAANLLWRSLSE